MVHTFRCLDRNFALDAESGSLYKVDELTKLLIEQRTAPDELSEGAFSRYSEAEIAEAKEEIATLEKEGVLFSPERPHKEREYTGVVKALCLNISHDCNMCCEYCFAHGGVYDGSRRIMPVENAIASIDFLVERSGSHKNLEVDFFGGEPLLAFNVIKRTVAYARKQERDFGKKFRFTVTTNATLLDNDAVDFCNREIDNVVISIDGRKNVHNSVRKCVDGSDAYRSSMIRAGRFLRKRGDRKYVVRGTYTALNLDFSQDVLSLANKGFKYISLEPVVLPSDHRLAIKEEHIPIINEQYEIIAREYLKRKGKEKEFTFFHFAMDMNGGPCETKRLYGCGAGCEYLAVAPNGKLYPCHRFDGNADFCMGTSILREVDERIPREFAACSVLSKPECRACWAKYYCSGGCNANAYEFNKDIRIPYRIGCDLMKKRIECALAVNSIALEK